MNIPDHIPTLWYEDRDGNFLGEPNLQTPNINEFKDAYVQISEFPFVLRTTHLELIRDASGSVFSSKQMATGESSWSEDLVNAMIRGDAIHKPMGAYRAIQIAAKACERCINSLGYEYHLSWGYAEFSQQWQNSRTRCEWCDEEKNKKKFEAPYKLTVGDAV